MSERDVMLLDGKAEPVTEEKSDYRVAQRRLNGLGRDAKRGHLVAGSREITAGGLELRRTKQGAVLVRVRKPFP